MSKKTSKSDPFAKREASRYVNPIPSREFLLDHIQQRGKPVQHGELARELQLDTEQSKEALQRRLKAMVRDHQLERVKKKGYWLAKKRVLVEGHVIVKKGRSKKMWVIPDDGQKEIWLSSKDALAVYPGNRVIVSVLDRGEEGIQEGRLVEVIEQSQMCITGRFITEQEFSYVIAHGKEMDQNILIPKGKQNQAQDGDIVVVELTQQPSRWSEPVGEIIEVLGSEDTPGIEVLTMIKAYGLPDIFPKEVIAEAKNVDETIVPSIIEKREDLRALPFVTIDGEDAKDFDDAVYCEKKQGGGFRLYVAIADVSYYVGEGTALDKEAVKRGNSVYFPGQVIPMLPEALSNNLCSLKPNVDRLCLVCILSIDQSGKITRYEFQEGVIRSQARLTYTKVSALISQSCDTKLKAQYVDLLPHLKQLQSLYQVLKKERQQRGAIEFETVETKILFSKERKIKAINPVERNEAHRIIEECMLCANVACARFLKKHKIPALYRIHEEPPPDKLYDLKTFLNEIGLPLTGAKKPKPIDYAKLLQSIQDRPDAHVIQTVLLRSLSQAVYSKDNVGHFGLAYPMYTHFTSPIRRYPDLLVHRQIKSVIRGHWDEKAQQESNKTFFKTS